MVAAVAAAVRRDLDELARRDASLAESGLAAAALALAAELDDPENSATSKAACARALNDTLESLRVLAPPAVERDVIDDLAKKRERRLAAGG